MEAIASLENFETFYSDTLTEQRIPCDAYTIRQNRSIVIDITIHFIFEKLPSGTLRFKNGKCDYADDYDIHKLLKDVVNQYYESKNNSSFSSDSNNYYSNMLRNLILGNTTDKLNILPKMYEDIGITLPDFSRAIERIYYNSKNTK